VAWPEAEATVNASAVAIPFRPDAHGFYSQYFSVQKQTNVYEEVETADRRQNCSAHSSLGSGARGGLRHEITAFSTIGPCTHALAAAVRREPPNLFTLPTLVRA
jgi:hypothetical protein